MRWTKSLRGEPPRATGNCSNLPWRGDPDRGARYRTAGSGNPEGGRIAGGQIMQHSGEPRSGGAAEDRRQHHGAEDAAVLPAFEDLGRDRTHDGGETVTKGSLRQDH